MDRWQEFECQVEKVSVTFYYHFSVLPVWAYETGTFHILIWLVIDENAFPKESGKIKVMRLDLGMEDIRGTFQMWRVGDKYVAVESRWTIATVTG